MDRKMSVQHLMVLLLGAMVTATLFGGTTAKAADNIFNGCGVNVHGSLVQANGAVGGGIYVGSRGQAIGGSVLCDVQMGKLVVGGFMDYDRPLGDIYDLGLRSDLTLGGRAGVVVLQNTMFYGHLGRSWLETNGAGTFQATKLGVGMEMRLPTVQPLFLDARYGHTYVEGTGSTKVDGDELRIGLTFKFGAGLLGISGPSAAPLK